MQFVSNDAYTVGAEWELQLLDRDTLDLTPGISSVMSEFGENPYVKPEFIQSCVEINTPVSSDSVALGIHLYRQLLEVLEVGLSQGMRLAGAGTHPFCKRLALITRLPRFVALAAAEGYIAHTELAFATHVHVGLRSGDAAMRVMRYLTPCLPVIIAISANSPFWRGYLTGYASYRRCRLAASRSNGIPPYFRDWAEFETFFRMAVRAGSFKTIKDIHWDIRPHPDFGTLEIRVADAQSCVSDVAFIAGVVRLLVAWIDGSSQEEIESVIPPSLDHWIDHENHYRACQWGMSAKLIADRSGRVRPIEAFVARIARALSPSADQLGETSALTRLRNWNTNSCGYWRQRMAFARAHNVRDVSSMLVRTIQSPIGEPAARGHRHIGT